MPGLFFIIDNSGLSETETCQNSYRKKPDIRMSLTPMNFNILSAMYQFINPDLVHYLDHTISE